MGRTVPSFRIALAQEETRWKPFREPLNKEERARFDMLFHSARLHISACMMSNIPVRIYPIMMSVILAQYTQLLCILREFEYGHLSQR